MKVVSSCIMVCLILLVVLSCASSNKAIIGEWEQMSGPIRYYEMRFRGLEKSGLVTGVVEVVAKDRWRFDVGYKFIGKNQIRLEDLNLGSDSQIYEVRISEDTLTLTDLSNGSVFKYKRAR